MNGTPNPPGRPLSREKSPYLLAHAGDEVAWRPWGEEAFEDARRLNLPVFLSIGYSACHWCHVMARESFRDPAIAVILNDAFIPVKVDREERPDVDAVYMDYVTATTGSGGWPLSVWLTPSLEPFMGGTYFPPRSFARALAQVAQAWKDDSARIREAAAEIAAALRSSLDHPAGAWVGGNLSASAENSWFELAASFDQANGGFGSAPKFPQVPSLTLLEARAFAGGDGRAAAMYLKALDAMAAGGIRDRLGGGFHRYSTDARWRVPHFEKMLPDQALLAGAYLGGYRMTGKAVYAEVARETLDYALRDLALSGGGFASSEDADSAVPDGIRAVSDGREAKEGAFYTWRDDELREALGSAYPGFARDFGVVPGGNTGGTAGGDLDNANILYESAPPSAESLSALSRLRDLRKSRSRPARDGKVILAWNAMLVGVLARASATLSEPRYLASAVSGARFLLEHLRRDGALYRRWCDGEAAVPAMLEDLAWLCSALLDLHEADGSPAWLNSAREMHGLTERRFTKAGEPGYFQTDGSDSRLPARPRPFRDAAEPSGNAVVARNLLRLHAITGDEVYGKALDRLLEWASACVSASGPALAPALMAVATLREAPGARVTIEGDPASGEARSLREAAARTWIPNLVVAHLPGQAPRAILCRGTTCGAPVTRPEELSRELASLVPFRP